MIRLICLVLMIVSSLGYAHPLVQSQESQTAQAKPRLLVLTDIGGDPDDQQSLIRLLLYANEFNIEGLIASASGTPGELKEKTTKPHLLREIVQSYARVRPNLIRHAPGYPKAEHLMSLIKSGNARRGREAVGEGQDTAGSRWIIQAVDKPDTRPLNVSIWGGQTDLAQALWRVRTNRGPEGLRRFVAKLRIHDIADQDGIAAWMLSEFPGLFYVLNRAPQGQDKRKAVFRGMYLGGDESLVSRQWMQTHIRTSHGPLGALYPSKTWTAPNPHGAIKEGDTPSWFFFLSQGLQDPAHPEWGGWGGRFQRERDRIYRDAQDRVGQIRSARATVWRWRHAYQADFQARLDWCVAPDIQSANHAPQAVLNGDDLRRILHVNTQSGRTVTLSCKGSTDPDGHTVKARWFIYSEAGTCTQQVHLSSTEGNETTFVAPNVSKCRTVHVMLELYDNGDPILYAYRRAVITIHPTHEGVPEVRTELTVTPLGRITPAISAHDEQQGTAIKWDRVRGLLGDDAERVLIKQLGGDLGGNTSVRNEAPLIWKDKGYYRRARDLGQVFTAPCDFTLEAIVLRTGNAHLAFLPGAASAEVFVQFFEVTGTPVINDNDTPPGTPAKHGFSTNHRCDDFVEGVAYKPLRVVTGGVLPNLAAQSEGKLTYMKWAFSGSKPLRFEQGKRYAFMIGFADPAPQRNFTLCNRNNASSPRKPAMIDGLDTYPGGWGLRREGSGKNPPLKVPGEQPPTDPDVLQQLQTESAFPSGSARYAITPTCEGYPDVDTYRDLEFYMITAL